jgi:starch-binding outer membrane protein, SusD/RagB family
MQDWAGAKAAAEALITANTYPLLTSQAGLKSMWTNDLATEVIFQAFTAKPNELANTNNIYLGLVPATGRFTPDFIPSQWVIDMYEPTDFRRSVYYEQKNVTLQGQNVNGIWLVNKYPGNPALFTGANTNYQHAPKIFRIAEMYLISAEAGARLGQDGPALTRLNQLRDARGASALVGLTGAALLQAIKDERTRELAFEGFRLDDLKRWHEGFARKAPQNTNIITTGAFYQGLTIAPDADKFVWGVPTNDMTINPNLTQNKGW